MSSNTQRTNEYIKKKGWESGIVEKWIPIKDHPGGGIRKDLWGIIDIISLGEGSIIGIQSCGQNSKEHDQKILQNKDNIALKWLKSHGRLMLISWRKIKKKRGGKLKVWAPRIKEYSIQDFKED